MIRIKALILFLLLCEPLIAQETDFGWIKISNKKAQPALKLLAKYNLELAGRYGVDGFDESILDLGPGSYERRMEESRQLIRDLTEAINKEQHPKVRQDLNILRDSVTEDMTGSELEHRLMLPFHDVAAIAFQGVNALLADNVADSRTRAEILLGGKFNQRAFHDFILRQGPLPPDLLAEAVMEEFIYKTKKQRRLTGESSKVSSLEPIPSWKFSCKTSATYKQRPTTFSVPSVTAG